MLYSCAEGKRFCRFLFLTLINDGVGKNFERETEPVRLGMFLYVSGLPHIGLEGHGTMEELIGIASNWLIDLALKRSKFLDSSGKD